MSNNPSNSLLALLAGVAIGAGLGILFAPESGRKTRQKIKEGVDEYSEELQQQLQELKTRVSSVIGAKSEQFQNTVDEALAETEEDSELLISQLEARLEQLKQRIAQGRAAKS
jgi:gas vesicle protein